MGNLKKVFSSVFVVHFVKRETEEREYTDEKKLMFFVKKYFSFLVFLFLNK